VAPPGAPRTSSPERACGGSPLIEVRHLQKLPDDFCWQLGSAGTSAESPRPLTVLAWCFACAKKVLAGIAQNQIAMGRFIGRLWHAIGRTCFALACLINALKCIFQARALVQMVLGGHPCKAMPSD
jgi:heme exporter protein D